MFISYSIDNYVCPKCGGTEGVYSENDYVIYKMCRACAHTDKVIKQAEAPLRCPKCGSTAITTGARGISGFWGAIGASKTVNRCGKCGLMFDPKKYH